MKITGTVEMTQSGLATTCHTEEVHKADKEWPYVSVGKLSFPELLAFMSTKLTEHKVYKYTLEVKEL